MSDYLDSLLTRSSEPVAGVLPRTPSVFERAPRALPWTRAAEWSDADVAAPDGELDGLPANASPDAPPRAAGPPMQERARPFPGPPLAPLAGVGHAAIDSGMDTAFRMERPRTEPPPVAQRETARATTTTMRATVADAARLPPRVKHDVVARLPPTRQSAQVSASIANRLPTIPRAESALPHVTGARIARPPLVATADRVAPTTPGLGVQDEAATAQITPALPESIAAAPRGVPRAVGETSIHHRFVASAPRPVQVLVSIGRVEVRAATASAKPAPAASRAAPSGLGEYLRRRDGGDR